MDPLDRFIMDAALDPPLDARAEAAAKAINPDVFANLDPKTRKCTEEQRARMRKFLSLAGLTFDDEGWNEFLSRPDAQRTLMAGMQQGVIRAGVRDVTIAFMRLREIAELALPREPFLDTSTAPSNSEPTPHPEQTTTHTERIEQIVCGGNVDWSGVQACDIAHVKTCYIQHLARCTEIQLAWHEKVRIAFEPYEFSVDLEEGIDSKNMRYKIRETNGRTVYLDGIYHDKARGWYVSSLPMSKALGNED